MEEKKLLLDRQKLELEQAKFAFEQQKNLRDRWWLEEGAVNQRLNWLLTAQAFIATGFAYIRQQSVTVLGQAASRADGALRAIGMTLPLFAILLCSIVFIGLFASHQAQDNLSKMGPPNSVGNSLGVRLGGRLVPIMITWIFMVGWLLVWLKT